MLQLNPAAIFGKGLHRECYVHPENADLCIKIDKSSDKAETIREEAYYRRLQKRQVPFTLLAEFYGEVETNDGNGAVFALVRDANGEISQTLEAYLESPELTNRHAKELAPALAELKGYLLRWCIITMTLQAKNIVFQRFDSGRGRLVIIDNIGNSDFLPICDYVPIMGRRKIERKWSRFVKTLRKRYPENPALQQILRALEADNGSVSTAGDHA